MLAQEVIHKKRNGAQLTPAEIEFFIQGLMDKSITEGQIAALAMAVFFQGMGRSECVALTKALQHSGTTLNWQQFNLAGPVLDKHSTGGVGDKVSIMLAPMLASCGAFVPMISGRGLGHTGGTLDKMESIPGYNATPGIEKFQSIVTEVGCSIVGQTAELAPADKTLYGIRDVTATVESISLITASILSKKLAAGLDGLVMDIKAGNGAFADNLQMARDLAKSITEVGAGLGLPTSALITDMSQVLGPTAGNSLEMIEVVDYLKSDFIDPRLHEVVLGLGAELLVLGGLFSDNTQAKDKLNENLASGLAAEYFERMVSASGGPTDFIENSDQYLTKAPVIVPYYPNIEGLDHAVISSMDTRAIGNVVVELGGGRRRAQDPVDHRVGLSHIQALGETVSTDNPVMMIHAKNQQDVETAKKRIDAAINYTAGKVEQSPVLIEILSHSSELES